MSRVSGWVATVRIPRALRNRVFGAFARAYGVIENDMMAPLESYESFNAFFTR